MNTNIPRVLLLTGTIDSSLFLNTGNQITDIQERLNQYNGAISYYINHSPFNKIVFAENSGYPIDVERFSLEAKSVGKTFEYLFCPVDRFKVIDRGKSYGEFMLLKTAFQTSSIIHSEDIVLKITGRLILENVDQLYKAGYITNRFLVYKSKMWCFTNIFQISAETFKNLFCSYEIYVNEKNGNDIERVFFRILKENKRLINPGSFSAWPSLLGKQGATLQNYKKSFIEMKIRNVLAFFNVFCI